MTRTQTTTSRLVALAQQRGSTATTPAGARRYLLRAVRDVSPIPIPDVDDQHSRWCASHSLADYLRERDERRAARIAEALGLPSRPDPDEQTNLIASLTSRQLADASEEDRGGKYGPYSITADEAVGEILRRVGPAGEQAQADEARYCESYDRIQYQSRKHAGRDWRGISRAAVARDGSAAILSYVEAGSYLHRRLSEPGAGGLHHLRIHAYLVVRDATSGNRHILRIPPRFGSTRSATWRRYDGDPDGLIHAATAWTFSLRPEAYHPEVAA